MPTTRPVPKRRRPTSWAGVPAAERRAERRTRLLDTAFDLLGTAGMAGTTVRSVCAGAQLNPRYFYESFDDLDALVVTVYDRVVDELTQAVFDAVERAPRDRRAQLRAAIDRIVGFVDEDRRRGHILYVEVGNEAMNRRRIETGHSLVELVERDAARRHGALPPGEHVGRVGAAILVGGFAELLGAWLDGRIDIGREQLVDDATELFLALGDSAGSIAQRRQRRTRN